MSEPTQPSLRRLRDFDVRPQRDLGQNFLIDSNLLDVIARTSDLGPEDVALEVGGGLGVLSEHLAARARHVHVVEIDTRLEAPLREALDPFENVTLHFADAVRLDWATLDPPPTKVIANLPYGVAATRPARHAGGPADRHPLGRDGAEARWASGSPPRPARPPTARQAHSPSSRRR